MASPASAASSAPAKTSRHCPSRFAMARSGPMPRSRAGEVAAAAVALLLRATTLGTQIRAVAANREAAELAGLPVRRVATSVWAIAGVLSAITAILLGPLRGANLTEVLGPGLMVRALA